MMHKKQPTHVIELLWRNRLARSAVNRKLGGSRPSRNKNRKTSKADVATKNVGTKLLISDPTLRNLEFEKLGL